MDVIIQCVPKDCYIPPNPFGKNMLNLLESERDGDVFFKVKDMRFGAHWLILKANASVLANFCGGPSSNSDIIIKDVKPHIFQSVLRFI